MEDNKSYLQKQADQLSMWGTEIDELKARVDRTNTESKRDLYKQIDELRVKTETARDNLIQVFFQLGIKITVDKLSKSVLIQR